jgi:PTS system nitrogen regulatory IIA component
MHFGATLRLLRTEAGISLRELASRIGVSGAYLSRVENGHDAAPTPDRLIAIADVLGLPRGVLVELARQTGPAVDSYLRRTPEAAGLFLDIARRELAGPQIARIKAFLAAEFPLPGAASPSTRTHTRLALEHVVVGVSCSDLDDLVSIAAARLVDQVDARELVRRVRNHERELAAIGGGFAILHAKLAGARACEVMLTLAHPLADTRGLVPPDGKPIRVFFVLVGDTRREGGEPAGRLDAIVRIARLATYEIAGELAAASTPEQVRTVVERVESLW